MARPIRAALALAVAVLGCALGCARAPAVVREPSWQGTPPASATPTYAETMEVLQFLVEEYPQGLPQRVSSPAPCVLRVVRSDDFSAYPAASAGEVYQSTWIDLSRVTELEAGSSGREAGPAPAPLATCAWLRGPPGFALQTDIVTAAREGAPRRHRELADEESPRVCTGNAAAPDRLAEPLRRLVTLCGGRAAVTATRPPPRR